MSFRFVILIGILLLAVSLQAWGHVALSTSYPKNVVVSKKCEKGTPCSENAIAISGVDAEFSMMEAPTPSSVSMRRRSKSRRRRRRAASRRRSSRRASRRRRRRASRRRGKVTPAPQPPDGLVPMPQPVPAPSPGPRKEPPRGPEPTPSPKPAPPKPPPSAPAPGPDGFRYQCKSTGIWDGSVTKFAKGTSFCSCTSKQNCAFICSGGKPNSEGQCGKAACSEGIYTFDDANTWTVTVKKEEATGGVYQAFAYLVWKHNPPAVQFDFSFKAIGHNNVFTKIFRLADGSLPMGDGSTILGLLPPTSPGGNSTMCFMPIDNSNRPACFGYSQVQNNKWYRSESILTIPGMAASKHNGHTAGTITFKVDGNPIGTTPVQLSMHALANRFPRLGAYHSGSAETYQMLFRDICLKKR